MAKEKQFIAFDTDNLLDTKKLPSGMKYKLIPIKNSGKTAIFISDPNINTNDNSRIGKSSKKYYTNRILIPSEERVTTRPDITSNRLEYDSGKYRGSRGQMGIDDMLEIIEKDQKFLKNKTFSKLNNTNGWISIKASDKKGSIKEDDLLARFIDTSVGVGNSNKSNARSVFVDWSVDAKVHTEPGKKGKKKYDQYPKDPGFSPQLQDLYSWVQRPNLYDVNLLDTTDSKFRPEAKEVLKAIVTGNPDDVATFKKIIAKNFTQREQRLLNRAIVKLEKTGMQGVAGFYRNAEKNRQTKDILVIDPYFLYKEEANKNSDNKEKIDEDTTTHEFIHMLRERDKERIGVQKAPPDYRGDGRDLEESMTDLETHARATSNPSQMKAGYHHRSNETPKPAKLKNIKIDIDDSVSKRLYDLMLLKKDWKELKPKVEGKDYYLPKNVDKLAGQKSTGFLSFKNAITQEISGDKINSKDLKNLKSVGISEKDINNSVKKIMKTKKGKLAIKQTEKAFPSSVLGSLKKHGSGELIDTFYEYKNRDGDTRIETQIYSPKSNVEKKDAIEIASLGRSTGKLIEEDDGKKFKKNLLKDISVNVKTKDSPTLRRLKKISKPKKFRR